MKHIFIFSLLISTNVTGMITIDFLSKTHDDLYAIIAKVEENKLQKNGPAFLRECVSKGKFEIIEQINQRDDTNKKCFLLYKQYLSFYKKCIAIFLPHEICKEIDLLYAQLKNIGRKETFIKTTKGPWENHRYNEGKPHLIISNDGYYFAHTISKIPELIYTKNNFHKTINTGYRNPLYFSPDNNYCIIKDSYKTCFYNLIQQKELTLIEKNEHQCFGITISNDSQYILFEGRDKIRQSTPIYFLWTLNANGVPQKINLKNNLLHSMTVIFHPDNNHIVHSQYQDELRLYNIVTAEDIIISPKRDENVFCIDTLTLTLDNTTIIAKTLHRDLNTQPNYILFNIENLDKVTAIPLSPQSYHKETSDLPILSIPNKKMLTHIINEGRTLQLIDHNAQCIASYDTKNNTHITALTVDPTGSYLAVGHSDGTIIIWNLFSSDPAQYDKTPIRSYDPITSLTFTDNQLLFSQSRAKEPASMLGNAILWDVYGNEIMNNLGDNIIDSIISPNGKTINVVSTTLQWHPERASLCEHLFTLTTYYQKDEVLAQYGYNGPNLAQLSRLINEWDKKDQT